jgi:hypothetical protein
LPSTIGQCTDSDARNVRQEGIWYVMQNGKVRQKPKALPKADPAKPLKNARHEAFVQSTMAGAKPADAYAAAGYRVSSPAVGYVEGFKLLRNTKVSRRLAYLQSRAADESILTKAWLIQETRDTYAAAKACGHHNAALKALQMLGLERGTFIPKTEHGGPGDFAGMSDEELDAYIADVDSRLRISPPEAEPERKTPSKPNGSGDGSVH